MPGGGATQIRDLAFDPDRRETALQKGFRLAIEARHRVDVAPGLRGGRGGDPGRFHAENINPFPEIKKAGEPRPFFFSATRALVAVARAGAGVVARLLLGELRLLQGLFGELHGLVAIAAGHGLFGIGQEFFRVAPQKSGLARELDLVFGLGEEIVVFLVLGRASGATGHGGRERDEQQVFFHVLSSSRALTMMPHSNPRRRLTSTGSLFQYGLIPNGGAYFQRGMSLKAEVWVDHYPHGDRHERTTIEHGGAITRLFKRHAGGAI